MHTSLAAKAIGVSKSTILRAMLLPLIPLADWFRTMLRVLIILLVTIVALYAIVVLYVIVVLLGVVGIHVPVHGFAAAVGGGCPWRLPAAGTRRQPFVNHAALRSGAWTRRKPSRCRRCANCSTTPSATIGTNSSLRTAR